MSSDKDVQVPLTTNSLLIKSKKNISLKVNFNSFYTCLTPNLLLWHSFSCQATEEMCVRPSQSQPVFQYNKNYDCNFLILRNWTESYCSCKQQSGKAKGVG